MYIASTDCCAVGEFQGVENFQTDKPEEILKAAGPDFLDHGPYLIVNFTDTMGIVLKLQKCIEKHNLGVAHVTKARINTKSGNRVRQLSWEVNKVNYRKWLKTTDYKKYDEDSDDYYI